jgi:metal-dependent amidase/aminoacylase/carboxypeptidase family protein
MCLASMALGAAAEESGAGKQILLERGAYKDMDVCIMYVW